MESSTPSVFLLTILSFLLSISKSLAAMTTAAAHRPKRLSLQSPAGLPHIPRTPSPSSATFTRSSSTSLTRRAIPLDFKPDSAQSTDSSSSEEEEYTLIGCLAGLSVSSLPPPISKDGSTKQSERGPVISRFPHPAPPIPSSALGTRAEQRRIYLGPKLSDRATGGPDAGPLIERFSCLFRDRMFPNLQVPAGQPGMPEEYADPVFQSIIARPTPKASFRWVWQRTS